MESAVLQQDYDGNELTRVARQNGVEGTVLVQVDQTETETMWLLEQADTFPLIKGVVGWVDLQAADIHDRLSHFSSYPKLKGFRHIVQSESPDFLKRPEFQQGIGTLRNFGFTYDILIYPQHMEGAIEMVRTFPDQSFVVDHLAKPNIRQAVIEPWKTHIKQLGAFSNVYCKISGMITEADHQNWNYQQLVPYMDTVLEVFGTERLMFGSDWPVCLMAGEYGQVLEVVQKYISGLSIAQQQQILGGNAVKFYNL
jgi:L-fuconolactonase